MTAFITYYFFDIVAVLIVVVAAGIGFRAAKDFFTIKNSR